GGGAYGAAGTSDYARIMDGLVASVHCYCAPAPGPPPLTPTSVSQHVMKFSGVPIPARKMIHTSADSAELYSAGAAATGDLPGGRVREDDQVTLVWAGATLGPGASR